MIRIISFQVEEYISFIFSDLYLSCKKAYMSFLTPYRIEEQNCGCSHNHCRRRPPSNEYYDQRREQGNEHLMEQRGSLWRGQSQAGRQKRSNISKTREMMAASIPTFTEYEQQPNEQEGSERQQSERQQSERHRNEQQRNENDTNDNGNENRTITIHLDNEGDMEKIFQLLKDRRRYKRLARDDYFKSVLGFSKDNLKIKEFANLILFVAVGIFAVLIVDGASKATVGIARCKLSGANLGVPGGVVSTFPK